MRSFPALSNVFTHMWPQTHGDHPHTIHSGDLQAPYQSERSWRSPPGHPNGLGGSQGHRLVVPPLDISYLFLTRFRNFINGVKSPMLFL